MGIPRLFLNLAKLIWAAVFFVIVFIGLAIIDTFPILLAAVVMITVLALAIINGLGEVITNFVHYIFRLFVKLR